MLGVVWSDNLILLFVFWELTSIASFMLIGFKHEDPAARASARQALAVTGAGSLAMLAGFLVLAMIGRDSGLSGVEALTASSLVGVDVTAESGQPAIALCRIENDDDGVAFRGELRDRGDDLGLGC